MKIDLVCPHCKKGHDRASMVNPNATLENVFTPADGDISMCFSCGDWSVFRDGKLCRPTRDELEFIRTDENCSMMMHAWLNMIIARHSRGNRTRETDGT